jgi:osmotically-inducible protein OsmY
MRIHSVFFLLLLTSCITAPAVVVLGTTFAGTSAVSARKPGFTNKDDGNIRKTIENSLELESDKHHYKNIRVTVFEGRVMLTGFVDDVKYKKTAVTKAIAVKSTAQIIDEIGIIKESYDVSSVGDKIISQQIWTKFRMDSLIISKNYDYEVIGGVVYVIGTAISKDEMLAVTTTISKIKGVNKVVSYIRVIEDK